MTTHSAPPPRRVLFLSVRNAARSLMAEAWLRQLGGDAFAVSSAGIEPAGAPDPLAIEAMREGGIDLADTHPRSSADLRAADYDLVIVLRGREGEQVPQLPGATEVAEWSFDDPSATEASDEETRARTYSRLRDELRTRVSLFINATTETTPPPAAGA